jgi:AraC-like DNA-binding protein
VATIVSSAQRTRFTPNLGLELARITPLGAAPLLDYLVVTSDTVGAGVRQLARYFRLVGNPVTLEVHEEGEGDIRVEMASGAAPFSYEYAASLMVLHFRGETDASFAVTSISFQHRPDDVAGFERILRCAVHAPSAWNGLSVPRDAWKLALRRRDSVLRHVLESHADEVVARQPKRHGVALDVQRALAARVAVGNTQIAAVARDLAMSGRTLQRRLTAEGVSYQQLLDEARKEAAGRHISDPTVAICEIAYLTGYSEPAPFHRAFKRWYGITPDDYRQKQREASQLGSLSGGAHSRTRRMAPPPH